MRSQYQNRYFVAIIAFIWCSLSPLSCAAPYITAEFDASPLDTNDRAFLDCKAYELGTQTAERRLPFFIKIERTVGSRTPDLLFKDQDLLPLVDDAISINKRDDPDDEPKIYSLRIRDVYHRRDTGTYTCSIIDRQQGNVVHSASAILQIYHEPEAYNPRCSINDFDKSLTRQSGDEVKLSCFSAFGLPRVNPPVWSYMDCNGESRSLPQAELTDSGAYYSELRVTLSNAGNGGRFFCTITREDFSRSCTYGAFAINGVTGCGTSAGNPAIPPVATPATPTQFPMVPPVIPATPQTAASPIITASISPNPSNMGDNVALFCEAYGLATGHVVTIERQSVSRTEPELLFEYDTLLKGNIGIVVSGSEPRMYTLSISIISYQIDAGTYTCKVRDLAGIEHDSASVDLMVNHLPSDYNPSCSILDDKQTFRRSGSEVILGCFTDLGYPPVNAPVWSYVGCNGRSKSLPEPKTLSNTQGYYSILTLTLTDEDNSGRFICTVSRSDGTYLKSCTIGTFTILGVTGCPEAGVTQKPATTMTTSVANTGQRITAAFDQSPVAPGRTAYLECKAYGLESGDFVTIERRGEISSRSEILFKKTEIWRRAPDNVFLLAISGLNPKTYVLRIRSTEYRYDAGTYTCMIRNEDDSVTKSASAVLQIRGPETAARDDGNATIMPPTSMPSKGSRESETFAVMTIFCLIMTYASLYTLK